MATRKELYEKAYGENAPKKLLYLLTIKDIKDKYNMARNNLTEWQKTMLLHGVMDKENIVYQEEDGVVIRTRCS